MNKTIDAISIWSPYDYDLLVTLDKIRRLTLKHRRACEKACNIGDFDESIIDKIEDKIMKIVNAWNQSHGGNNLIKDIEFQRDPRGWTVTLKEYKQAFIINGDL